MGHAQLGFRVPGTVHFTNKSNSIRRCRDHCSEAFGCCSFASKTVQLQQLTCAGISRSPRALKQNLHWWSRRVLSSCPALPRGTSIQDTRVAILLSSPVLEVRNDEELVTERTIEEAEQAMIESQEEYNQRMRRAMHNPYEYHHHLGMYYTRILPKLIVGSQPQSVDDVSKLHYEEGVEVVLNLQQDHDIAFWGIDLHPIRERCLEHGMKHYRRPAVDFDPHSLRLHLPRMVSVVEHYVSQGKTVYVHCTAGLGRAPGSAIAYLFWFHGMDLKHAYEFLTSKRPCGPKWDAIRGATYDLANEHPHKIPLEHLPQCAFTDVSQWERDLIQLRVRQLYHPHHH